MLFPGFLRIFLFLQVFLFVSFVAGQMDSSDSDKYSSDDDDYDYPTTSTPQTTQARKAFFARDPPKPTESDTAETSTTMSGDDKGVAIPDKGDSNTTPSPSSTSSTESPGKAPVFFARDPPKPSESSSTTETPGSDDVTTKTTKKPDSGGDSVRSKESNSEDFRTTKDPSEDVTEDSKSSNEIAITTKKPKSESDPSVSEKRSRNIIHAQPVNPSGHEEGFGQLSTNHKSIKEPHYHLQTLNSGVAIPIPSEDITTNGKKSQGMTTVAPSVSSQSGDERSSQARAIQSTILNFIVDTLTRLRPLKNIRRAFDMHNMSAKTVKTLLYGIVFHFPDGTEIPEAEKTCKVLDKALSDNFERVQSLNNSLVRVLTSAVAKFLTIRRVLNSQNEDDLSDWFVTCFNESLGDVHDPTESQSMYAIGDGFVNFLDSMDLYLPSSTKFLAKYIAEGLYAVL